jgi:hypothetical protein
MQTPAVTETMEKLIRLQADRRGNIVGLLVHYVVSNVRGCKMYRIITVEEVN